MRGGAGTAYSRGAASAALILAAGLPLVWDISPWAGRFLCTGIWVWIGLWAARGPSPRLLGTALFLLPSSMVIFYSLVCSIYVAVIGGPLAIDSSRLMEEARLITQQIDYPPDLIRATMGGPGELLILRVAMLCCAVFALLGRVSPRPLGPADVSPIARVAVMAVAVGIAGLHWGRERWGIVEAGAVLVPLAMLCLGYAIHWALEGRRLATIQFAVMVVVLGIGLANGGMKQLALVAGAGTIALAMSGRHGLGRLARIGAIAFLAALIGITAIGMMRNQFNPAHLTVHLNKYFRGKLIVRQGETVFCLTAAQHAAAQGDHDGIDAAYFAGVFVPRALWPDKPNYSRGNEYAVDYCLFTESDRAIGQHSASITVLGEPVLGGGPVLAGFLALMLALLAAASLATARAAAPIAAIAWALTAWLADFDQAAALYLGTTVKGAAIMIPAALALWWLSGPRRAA